MRLSGPSKRLIPLVFAVVMGLVAVGLLRQYVSQQRQTLEQERKKLLSSYPEPIQVVIAGKDISEGVPLEPSLLSTTQVPERFIQPYAVRAAGEVLGLITLTPIAEGEQILLNKLRRPDTAPKDATLSALTPKGKRAVTIGVDVITGVGGFVRPGDTVDVLWTLQVPQPGQSQGEVVTMTLFQEVPVLAVGSEIAGRSKSKQEASPEYTVTLALTPQETSFLLFAREQGRLQLSLRARAEDKGSVAVAPANMNALMETMLGAPAGPPTPTRPGRAVEVYKGLKRDVVQLPAEAE